ncbi:hypothetical protein Aduo_002207 [Ancylostoma duodenale]
MSADELDALLDDIDPTDPFATIIGALKVMDGKIEALHTTLAEMSQFVSSKLGAIDAALARRSHSRPICIFCPNEQNRDGHPSGRCRNYSDVVARTIRVASLSLCGRCLLPRHDMVCETTCSCCGCEHVLLCPLRNAELAPKRRK